MADDLSEFEAYWSEQASQEWGGHIAWVGSGGVHASMTFPDERALVDAVGQPVGRFQIAMNAQAARSDPDSFVSFFVDTAKGLGAFYACAYVLRGWSISRGVLSLNVHQSEVSPLPGGRFWIGLPPGAPWLSFFGPVYAELVRGLVGALGDEAGGGLLVRTHRDPQAMDEAASIIPSLPDDLLAQRPDPRFWAVTPSAPARIIPDVSQG